MRARSASSSASICLVGAAQLALGDVLHRLVLHVAATGTEVLQFVALDVGQRLDGVDVLRLQFGAARLGQERRMLQRRAALGLRDMRLELLVLMAEPLGVALLDLAAGRTGRRPSARKLLAGKYLDVRASRARG